MRMRMNFKQCILILAMALSIGMTGSTLRAAMPAPPQDKAQAQDYSKNKNYQVGTRDGKNVKAHNKDHSRNRKFKKDDDQKAYESGYQQARH